MTEQQTDQAASKDVALPSDGDQAVKVAEPPPHSEAMSELVQWAFDARQAHLIAQSLAQTNFVPSTMRNNAHNITAAILTGQELGLKPMTSLRSMDIISGTPALRANAMRGLLQSHGHEIETLESTDQKCIVQGRRWNAVSKSFGNWQRAEWSWSDAQRAGLTQKDNWKNYPAAMLLARATSQLCRMIGSDVLQAMPYAIEELGDGGETGRQQQVTTADLTQPALGQAAPSEPAVDAAPAGDTGAAQEQPAAPEQTAPAEPEPTPEPAPAAQPEPAQKAPEPAPAPPMAGGSGERIRQSTGRQRGEIHRLAELLGFEPTSKDVDTRAEYLAELSVAVNRDVTSSNELSYPEAGMVIALWQKKADEAPKGE